MRFLTVKKLAAVIVAQERGGDPLGALDGDELGDMIGLDYYGTGQFQDFADARAWARKHGWKQGIFADAFRPGLERLGLLQEFEATLTAARDQNP
jgi:hypothetical protein